jgi:hypothetical protein
VPDTVLVLGRNRKQGGLPLLEFPLEWKRQTINKRSAKTRNISGNDKTYKMVIKN